MMSAMKPQVDPKVDYAFKHEFGREESKPCLMSLVDAVLQPRADQRLMGLELLNPFNDQQALNDKLSVLDIKARDVSGRLFNVEMQMLAYGAFRQRALYYWSKLHQSQLRKGMGYHALRPTIAICFVDTPLFPELAEHHLAFELRERHRQTLFTDQLAVHILELSKFNKTPSDLTTPLDLWLYFLRHAQELDADTLPARLDVPEVRWALGDLIMITQSERDRERYESRLKMQRDVYTALIEAREEGRTAGREEGRAEGEIERIRSFQRLLGEEVTDRQQLQALSLGELEGIAARLEADLKAQLKNGS
jgi:predicted transposase/invertase (TIGR01784 family)